MDDLTTFQPFRFVGHDKQVTKAGKDYLAFGMGRHACPGMENHFIGSQQQLHTSIDLRSLVCYPRNQGDAFNPYPALQNIARR